MRLLSLILLITLSAFSFGIDAYKCKVQFASGLTDQGELTETPFAKLHIGKEFVVDKSNGKIVGEISNSNENGTPQVLDWGSNEQAFKVITVYKPMTAVAYLYVQEFNVNIEKPFMYINGDNSFTGLCEAY